MAFRRRLSSPVPPLIPNAFVNLSDRVCGTAPQDSLCGILCACLSLHPRNGPHAEAPKCRAPTQICPSILLVQRHQYDWF